MDEVTELRQEIDELKEALRGCLRAMAYARVPVGSIGLLTDARRYAKKLLER